MWSDLIDQRIATRCSKQIQEVRYVNRTKPSWLRDIQTETKHVVRKSEVGAWAQLGNRSAVWLPTGIRSQKGPPTFSLVGLESFSFFLSSTLQTSYLTLVGLIGMYLRELWSENIYIYIYIYILPKKIVVLDILRCLPSPDPLPTLPTLPTLSTLPTSHPPRTYSG